MARRRLPPLNVHRRAPFNLHAQAERLFRSLSTFLHNPSAHLTQSWALIRSALPISGREDFNNALVLVDNVVEAVALAIKCCACLSICPDEDDEE